MVDKMRIEQIQLEMVGGHTVIWARWWPSSSKVPPPQNTLWKYCMGWVCIDYHEYVCDAMMDTPIYD